MVIIEWFVSTTIDSQPHMFQRFTQQCLEVILLLVVSSIVARAGIDVVRGLASTPMAKRN